MGKNTGVRLLVVEDTLPFRQFLKEELEEWQPEFATTADAALEILREQQSKDRQFDVVLLDLKLPRERGLVDEDAGFGLLQAALSVAPSAQVIIISGRVGDVDLAVKAIRLGAVDYLVKGEVTSEKLRRAVRNAVRLAQGERRGPRASPIVTTASLIGGSAALEEVRSLITRYAPLDDHVLITGENGTGKDLAASALHQHSRRRAKEFLHAHLAGQSPQFVVDALLGHVKGTYTGAMTDREGFFELADGATLFLNEIGDFPPDAQVALLRVLEHGKFRRQGEYVAERTTRARVLAATNRNLEQLVADGTFREDLFYRLSALWIHIPPLRERPDDILPIARDFLATRFPDDPPHLDDDTVALLEQYSWPGNVRQLQNVLKAATVGKPGAVLLPADVEPHLRGPQPQDRPTWRPRLPAAPASQVGKLPSLAEAKRQAAVKSYAALRERTDGLAHRVLLRTLIDVQGNVSESATVLGIDRSTVSKLLPEASGWLLRDFIVCGGQFQKLAAEYGVAFPDLIRCLKRARIRQALEQSVTRQGGLASLAAMVGVSAEDVEAAWAQVTELKSL
jgi:DNA-binding NtrC family response regulator